MSQEVFVFADWEEFEQPCLVGSLRSDLIKGKEHFRFVYHADWLASPFAQKIDPDLHLFSGDQFSNEPQQNFRIFLDSCPDRWGRLLMKRREAALANQQGLRPKNLTEMDYLLGVHDTYRMGALRFKTDLHGPFLDNSDRLTAPPISSLRELEYAAAQMESDAAMDDPDYIKWLFMLISPGSSLGGARPKSCVINNDQSLWIAKFPSRYDDHDVGAWEYLTHQLALDAGIKMSECRVEKFGSHHHTFLTKRFDRTPHSRLHFTSALTQLGYYDGDYDASYLELAQFLTEKGANAKMDLEQLWRRIVFNIAVSNTDDHLRNHGFIYQNGGWLLSPAYDINPVVASTGLHLNITDSDNRLDFSLAMEVAEFFQLSKKRAADVKDEILASVQKWKSLATDLGLSRNEQLQMESAFNF